MHNIRYNAARGSVGVICNTSGLVEANYSGPLCARVFDALRTEMMVTTDKARASVVRLDRSLILASALPKLPPGKIDTAPAALIVRPEQYDIFFEYAKQLATQGALRLVFRDCHAHYAYEWALSQCQAGAYQSHQDTKHKPSF